MKYESKNKLNDKEVAKTYHKKKEELLEKDITRGEAFKKISEEEIKRTNY